MSFTHGLRRRGWAILGFGAMLVACVGCESAHYLIRNSDNGIVAIPRDTPELRTKAEKLMHDQFPGGYVLDDVRVVPLGRPYHTVTQIGPVAEVRTHQEHEVMLYYHAGHPGSPKAVTPGTPVVQLAGPPTPLVTPTVQPVSHTALPDGLPAAPIPVQ